MRTVQGRVYIFALLSLLHRLTSLKVLSLGNEKKIVFFFCISLVYSYLCTRFY